MEEKGVIRHSDIYLGETYDDGIRHWKYIRKEKKNGYTRYYYKDDEYDKAEEDFENAVENQYRKELEFGVAAKEHSDFHEKANEDMRTSQEEARKSSQLAEKSMNKLKEYRDAAKIAEITEKKYKQTKLKTLPRRTIGKGIAAVSTALSMLASKIKKKLKD